MDIYIYIYIYIFIRTQKERCRHLAYGIDRLSSYQATVHYIHEGVVVYPFPVERSTTKSSVSDRPAHMVRSDCGFIFSDSLCGCCDSVFCFECTNCSLERIANGDVGAASIRGASEPRSRKGIVDDVVHTERIGSLDANAILAVPHNRVISRMNRSCRHEDRTVKIHSHAPPLQQL